MRKLTSKIFQVDLRSSLDSSMPERASIQIPLKLEGLVAALRCDSTRIGL